MLNEIRREALKHLSLSFSDFKQLCWPSLLSTSLTFSCYLHTLFLQAVSKLCLFFFHTSKWKYVHCVWVIFVVSLKLFGFVLKTSANTQQSVATNGPNCWDEFMTELRDRLKRDKQKMWGEEKTPKHREKSASFNFLSSFPPFFPLWMSQHLPSAPHDQTGHFMTYGRP